MIKDLVEILQEMSAGSKLPENLSGSKQIKKKNQVELDELRKSTTWG